jgi:hypothetical protein
MKEYEWVSRNKNKSQFLFTLQKYLKTSANETFELDKSLSNTTNLQRHHLPAQEPDKILSGDKITALSVFTIHLFSALIVFRLTIVVSHFFGSS